MSGGELLRRESTRTGRKMLLSVRRLVIPHFQTGRSRPVMTQASPAAEALYRESGLDPWVDSHPSAGTHRARRAPRRDTEQGRHLTAAPAAASPIRIGLPSLLGCHSLAADGVQVRRNSFDLRPSSSPSSHAGGIAPR